MNIGDLHTNEFWTEYDWREVLGQPAEYAHKGGAADPVYDGQIAEVIWLTADSPEGYASVNMACIVRLNDGTFAMCEAWCDTTGWDCRGSVTWKVAPSILLAASELSEENRAKLTLQLVEG